MGSCNILSISKIVVETEKIKITAEDSIEFSKIQSSLLNNDKISLYMDTLKENGAMFDIINNLSTDLIEKCLSVIEDITLEVEYDQPMGQLAIAVKLLLQKADQLNNPTYYDLAIDLYEKYESIIIESNLADSLSIDFDVILRNEYIKTITIKEERK